ncbi:Venom allergen 5, partial [Araneus ventricosus]
KLTFTFGRDLYKGICCTEANTCTFGCIGCISCMLKAMWSFLILALFGLVSWSSSAKCPADYERFSLEHTFCISRNPRCDIKRSGVSQQDIQEILRLHNQYRNDLALGKETRAKGGTLPKAADMLQMVWDEELAAIAQKWAENCDFNHDCDECRTVRKYTFNILTIFFQKLKEYLFQM